jgi:RNA recognition motif-containing protein
MYEDELIPVFEKCGTIWELRLMMNPMTNLHRGFAFVKFTTAETAQQAVNQVRLVTPVICFM